MTPGPAHTPWNACPHHSCVVSLFFAGAKRSPPQSSIRVKTEVITEYG